MIRPMALSEDQRKHLDYIQAVIARLAASSAAAKGWSLTVATATFGFSAAQAVPFVAFLGIVVVISFAVIDSYYLREDRLFRQLYDDARKGNAELYSMDKNKYAWTCKKSEVFWSWSVAGFYGPTASAGVIALMWSVLC